MDIEEKKSVKYGGREVAFTIFVLSVSIGAIIFFNSGIRLEKQHPLVGKPAPEIEFQLTDGKPSSLSKNKGSLLLLNFWASWCRPCMDEMPSLRMLENHFSGRGLMLLAFNIGEQKEDFNMKFSGAKMPKNLIFHFSRDNLRPYDVNSLPMSILIDKFGMIRGVWRGPRNWADISIIKEFESLLR